MTIKQYSIVMGFATVVCLAALGFVMLNVDPFKDTGMGLLFFYLTFFLSVLGVGSLMSIGALARFSKQEYTFFEVVHKSFMMSVGISAVLTALLYLQSLGVLHMWNLGLFLAIVVFFLLFRYSVLWARRREG